MDDNKEKFYSEFIQRENNFLRAPYNPEIEFYNTIKSGDIERTKELCKEPLVDKEGLGHLSDDKLQNLKYHFVVTTALVARYCIEGGMDLSEAYGLSDYYILKADRCKQPVQITKLHPVMCVDYATHMHELRKNSICSEQIAQCIDYIYDNLHERITVERLAAHVHLDPSYLSRLFKREVGVSISEYIRNKKIETAKNMLIYSESKPVDIAQILAFPSQSYFTEVFKKQIGVSPTEYKKEHFRTLHNDE
ncbi:MAG: AraC family transcriptional regulator [Eubacterium sp.]|nr:AraC family transcriptional regulator [Eubacterium sp.]